MFTTCLLEYYLVITPPQKKKMIQLNFCYSRSLHSPFVILLDSYSWRYSGGFRINLLTHDIMAISATRKYRARHDPAIGRPLMHVDHLFGLYNPRNDQ